MAKKRTSRTKAPRTKRNPDELAQAATLSAKFHGRPAHRVRQVQEDRSERDVLADLGRMVELTIRTERGDKATLEFGGRVRLACSPDGGQLYFVGGDQEQDLGRLGLKSALPKDHLQLGEAREIVYYTSKVFHNFEPSEYKHRFGEESGSRPTLNYDVLNKALYLTGGRYKVRPEGIVD